jgi:formylglycine-generating enzyme required for sulfatase activity
MSDKLVAEQLRMLIERYGKDVCSDSKRLEALLRDYCPNDTAWVNILLTALSARVPKELLESTMPLPLLRRRLIQQLQQQYGLTEAAAQWAVETWAQALGLAEVVNTPVATNPSPQTPVGDPSPAYASTPPVVKESPLIPEAIAGKPETPEAASSPLASWVTAIRSKPQLALVLGLFLLVLLGRRHYLSDPASPKPTPPSPSPPNKLVAGLHLLQQQYGMETVEIPAGEFVMGSTEAEVSAVVRSNSDDKQDQFADELPPHKVELDKYYIGKTPVTVGQYKQFCKATRRDMPPAPKFNPKWGKKDHPIVNVSWDDAKAYCKWLGQQSGLTVRLPTEAQWEKAARGTDGRRFPWGNEFKRDRLQCSQKTKSDAGGTATAGSHPLDVSFYGVLDMAGNVQQWCLDRYGPHYYHHSPSRNPPGPSNASTSSHVERGGSWINLDPNAFRCANRNWNDPKYIRQPFVGFRCVVQVDTH